MLIRLPLRLTKNVKLEEYIEKSEIADAGKFWNFDAGNVTVVELPNPDHEVAHTQFTRQFLSAFSNVAVQDDVDNIAGTSTYSFLCYIINIIFIFFISNLISVNSIKVALMVHPLSNQMPRLYLLDYQNHLHIPVTFR